MRVNAADIEAAITPRTRAVIINSPGNPTGAVTSAAELARIAEVCKQHNIWAISDEVYHPFVFGETFGETLGGEAAVAPSIAAVPGHERPHHCGGKPVENLRDDRLAASATCWHPKRSSNRPVKSPNSCTPR